MAKGLVKEEEEWFILYEKRGYDLKELQYREEKSKIPYEDKKKGLNIVKKYESGN